MNTKLGAHIAALRKAKEMTQEQLAMALGISAPAVSKWENNSSCPDISLLCPLARALGTNVDTLLQFEESLTIEELNAAITDVVELIQNSHSEEAENTLQQLLHTYPSSTALKYNVALVMDTFVMLLPSVPEEKREAWRAQKKQLFEDIRSAGPSEYWQKAVYG